MSSFSFSELTPDRQLDALDSVGIHAETGLLALNSYENRVYQFGAEDGQRYVVKFYRPQRWSDQQIEEEHEFALEIAAAEVPLIAPLKLNNQTLHHHQGYRFTLYPSVGGRQFEVDNLEQLEWVGRYMGRIHQTGKAKCFTSRPTIGLDEYLYQARETLHNIDFIPDHLKNTFFSDLNLLIKEIESQWHTDWAALRLHGDCHPGNILWRDSPLFVDLDDARNGPAVQDLWMLLSGSRQDKLVQLDTVLNGYEEFCPFDTRQLQLIEPLRGLRMVHHMAWLARRWEDPAFPLAFPWFADNKYWEQQVLSFKEQISVLREPPLSLMPQW